MQAYRQTERQAGRPAGINNRQAYTGRQTGRLADGQTLRQHIQTYIHKYAAYINTGQAETVRVIRMYIHTYIHTCTHKHTNI